jgi:uncharacterized RDD family membrane protein YckC
VEPRPPLASLWRRFFALLIDQVLVLVPPFAVLALAVLAYEPGPAESGRDLSTTGAVVFLAIAYLLPPVYFTVAHARPAGQTIGKRLLGIRVVDAWTGGRVSYWRSFERWLVTFVLLIACGGILSVADGLAARNHPDRQTWHDRAAGTIVVAE